MLNSTFGVYGFCCISSKNKTRNRKSTIIAQNNRLRIVRESQFWIVRINAMAEMLKTSMYLRHADGW